MNDQDALGIDFGTTNSAVATVFPDGSGRMKPLAIADDAFPNMPTAVYFDEDRGAVVGREALVAGVQHPDGLYTEFKRSLGEESPVLGTLPGGVAVSADDLAGIVFRKLLERAAQFKLRVRNPVVCHPAGDPWAQTIYRIMKQVGVDPIMLSEPEAALYYANDQKHVFDERNQTVLLIDFGGGTCDFILMKVHASLARGLIRPVPEVIDEDRLDFGGKDLDLVIKDEFIRRWQECHPTRGDLLARMSDRKYDWLLKSAAKDTKEKLSRMYRDGVATEEVAIDFDKTLPGSTSLHTSLSPSELCDLTLPILERHFFDVLVGGKTEGTHKPLLSGKKGVHPQDVSMIILVGGSSQLPWLSRNILPKLFPSLYMDRGIVSLDKPDMAVAFGAALYSHDLLYGKPRLRRFLQEDLRIELEGGETLTLAKRHTTLPLNKDDVRARHFFAFPSTGHELTVNLVAGENQRAAACRPLSFSPRKALFEETVQKGTWMQMQVGISTKGEVQLYVARVFRPGQTCMLFFSPLDFGEQAPGRGREQ